MKSKILKFFLLSLALQQFCYAQNLVQDSSFENGSGFTAQGWYSWAGGSPTPAPLWFPVDTLIPFPGGWDSIQDAPPGGGVWSLQLFASGNGSDWTDATYFITGQQDTAVYTLSVWAKRIWYTFSGPLSHISIQKGPFTDFSDYVNYLPFDTLDNKTLHLDTLQQWKKYILIDTITTVPTDTIFVSLFAEAHLVNTEIYRFDLVQLTAISLTSTQNTLHLQPEDIKIYPNPFSESAVLRITNPHELRIADINVFDVFGKEVHPTIIRNSDTFVIRSEGMLLGIYVCEIRTNKSTHRKKIVIAE